MSLTTVEAARKYDVALIHRTFNGKRYRQVGRAFSKEDGLKLTRHWRTLGYQAKSVITAGSYHTNFGRRQAWLIWAWRK